MNTLREVRAFVEAKLSEEAHDEISEFVSENASFLACAFGMGLEELKASVKERPVEKLGETLLKTIKVVEQRARHSQKDAKLAAAQALASAMTARYAYGRIAIDCDQLRKVMASKLWWFAFEIGGLTWCAPMSKAIDLLGIKKQGVTCFVEPSKTRLCFRWNDGRGGLNIILGAKDIRLEVAYVSFDLNTYQETEPVKEPEIPACTSSKPVARSGMIYTIGYRRSSLERIRKIAEALNATVVDVRGVPNSQTPEFRRASLEKALPKYMWKGDVLGNYKGYTVTQEGLDWLKERSESENLILMCMEPAPGDCHRHHQIAMRLDVPVYHICLATEELIEAKELQRAIDDDDDYAYEEPTWLLSA